MTFGWLHSEFAFSLRWILIKNISKWCRCRVDIYHVYSKYHWSVPKSNRQPLQLWTNLESRPLSYAGRWQPTMAWNEFAYHGVWPITINLRVNWYYILIATAKRVFLECERPFPHRTRVNKHRRKLIEST